MSNISLNNIFSAQVSWQRFAVSNFKIDQQVDIWRISVTENLFLLNTLTSVLNPGEIARANRYLRKEDHDRFIISRASLRHILSKYINQKPSEITFELEPNRKPYIPDSDIQYNLSDSDNQVLIAVSRQAVGIDVEYIKPKFYYDSILPLNFSRPEIDYINGEEQLQRFFMLWTRKEAILKATGIGLTDHLKLIPSLDGKYIIEGDLLATATDWKLTSFISSPHYIATVAVAPKINRYNFYEFNFGDLFV